jgi:hypothetical protein
VVAGGVVVVDVVVAGGTLFDVVVGTLVVVCPIVPASVVAVCRSGRLFNPSNCTSLGSTVLQPMSPLSPAAARPSTSVMGSFFCSPLAALDTFVARVFTSESPSAYNS